LLHKFKRDSRYSRNGKGVRMAYDRIASSYDLHYRDNFSVAENAVIKQYLARKGFTNGRVLDLGCGTGLLITMFNIPPTYYAGLDVSEGMLTVARRKFPNHHFVQASMDNIPFGDAEFDRVICLFGGISYVKSHHLSATIREIFRVLRAGGRLFIMAYGKAHYCKKEDYILHDQKIERHLFTNRELFDLVFPLFPVSKVIGMNSAVELYRRASLSIKSLMFLMQAEIDTVGHEIPDFCQYQIAIGEKIIGETSFKH